jgi:hypothetical protein
MQTYLNNKYDKLKIPIVISALLSDRVSPAVVRGLTLPST